jgi:hypothetical protein
MPTLVQDIADIKDYCSTAFDFSFETIQPYVIKAERQAIKPLIGADTYNAWATSAPTTGTPKEAYKLFKEASANLSALHYLPIGVVNISDSGITVSKSQHTETASYGQILDLKRSFLEIANSAIDEALETMEANSGAFPLWTSSSAYTVFKELIVPKTSDFNRFFNINNSRQTFTALKPYQLEIQSKIFDWLDAQTLNQIKDSTDNAVELKAKEYAQRAQVNYTVAIAADSGVFLFKSTGMFNKHAEVPVEKHHLLTEHQIKRLIDSRNSAAAKAMAQLKMHVLENLDTFSSYTAPTETPIDTIVNTKSITSF